MGYGFTADEEVVVLHPAQGMFCGICGEITEGEHDRELHAQGSVIRFCDICGADKANGETCDAGLHG